MPGGFQAQLDKALSMWSVPMVYPALGRTLDQRPPKILFQPELFCVLSGWLSLLLSHQHTFITWWVNMTQRIDNLGGTLHTGVTTAVQRGPVGNGIVVLQGSFLTILSAS